MTEKPSFCCGLTLPGRDNRSLVIDDAMHKVVMEGIRSYFDDPSALEFALDPILQPFLKYLIGLHNSTVDEHDSKLTIEALVATAFKRVFVKKEIASRTAMLTDIHPLRAHGIYSSSAQRFNGSSTTQPQLNRSIAYRISSFHSVIYNTIKLLQFSNIPTQFNHYNSLKCNTSVTNTNLVPARAAPPQRGNSSHHNSSILNYFNIAFSL